MPRDSEGKKPADGSATDSQAGTQPKKTGSDPAISNEETGRFQKMFSGVVSLGTSAIEGAKALADKVTGADQERALQDTERTRIREEARERAMKRKRMTAVEQNFKAEQAAELERRNRARATKARVEAEREAVMQRTASQMNRLDYSEIDADPNLSGIFHFARNAIEQLMGKIHDSSAYGSRIEADKLLPEEYIDLHILRILNRALDELKRQTPELNHEQKKLVPLLMYRLIEFIGEDRFNYFSSPDQPIAYVLSENQSWITINTIIHMLAKNKPDHKREILDIADNCADFKSLLYFAKWLIQAPDDEHKLQRYLHHRDTTGIYTDTQRKFIERLQKMYPESAFPVDNLRVRRLTDQIIIDLLDPFLGTDPIPRQNDVIALLQEKGFYEEGGRLKEVQESHSLTQPIRTFINRGIRDIPTQRNSLKVLATLNNPHAQGVAMAISIRRMRSTESDRRQSPDLDHIPLPQPTSWSEDEISEAKSDFLQEHLTHLGSIVQNIVLDWLPKDDRLAHGSFERTISNFQEQVYQYMVTGKPLRILTELKAQFEREIATQLFLTDIYREVPPESALLTESFQYLKTWYRASITTANQREGSSKLIEALKKQYNEEKDLVTQIHHENIPINFILAVLKNIAEPIIRIHLWKQILTIYQTPARTHREEEVCSQLSSAVYQWIPVPAHKKEDDQLTAVDQEEKEAFRKLIERMQLEVVIGTKEENIIERLEQVRLQCGTEVKRLSDHFDRKRRLRIVVPVPAETQPREEMVGDWISCLELSRNFTEGTGRSVSENQYVNLASQVELITNGHIGIRITIGSQGKLNGGLLMKIGETEEFSFQDMPKSPDGKIDIPQSRQLLNRTSRTVNTGVNVLRDSVRDSWLALEKPLTSMEVPKQVPPYMGGDGTIAPSLKELLSHPPTLEEIQQALKNLSPLEKAHKPLEFVFFHAFTKRIIAMKLRNKPDFLKVIPDAFKVKLLEISREQLREKSTVEIEAALLKKIPSVDEDHIELTAMAFAYNGLVEKVLKPWIDSHKSEQSTVEALDMQIGNELESQVS